MDYAMHQEAVLTAYNVVDSLKQDTPSVARSLALYAPRGTTRDEFVSELLEIIRDTGLEGAEVFAKTAAASGVTFVTFAETGGPASYVLVTVSDFPVFTAPPVSAVTPLDDITWSLPVVCCGKTWYPRFLLPELQRLAFSEATKLHAIFGHAIDTREAAGWDMPTDKTEKWFNKIPAPAAETPPPAYLHEVDMECLCDDAWDGIAEFAAWLIQLETLPLARIQLPYGFDLNSLMYLHTLARHQYQFAATTTQTPLTTYIYASMASPMHRLGLSALLVLPFFMGTKNPYRAQVSQAPM